jgi:ABC-2 type transport system ATP-binding protein
VTGLVTGPREAVTTDPSDIGPAVETTALTKRFGDRVAVDGIDLRVPRGAVYGFLGPNGSGKTTTIRMLLGLVEPTSGTRSLLGHAIPGHASAALRQVGALVEGPAFHPYLSGRKNLARLDAADRWSDPRSARVRIDAALDRVGLLAAATKRYRAYSLGMRQRLAIAAALLTPRELLVLDEPTNGLDPQGTREVRHLVASLAADGATVLVSSHLLSEVEQVCTHLGVMSDGRLVAQGPTDQLRGTGTATVRVQSRQPAEAAAVLRRLGLTDVTPGAGEVQGTLGGADPEALLVALVRAGVAVSGFTVTTPSLEDLFVELTGEGFDVSG